MSLALALASSALGYLYGQAIPNRLFESGPADATLLRDWLPQDHLAQFMAQFMADVTEELDLGSIYQPYEKTGEVWLLISL